MDKETHEDEARTVHYWQDRLLNTKFSRCDHDRRRRSECQRWDLIHDPDPTQTADTNWRRKNDRVNFEEWASLLCRLRYAEVSPPLEALDSAGFCMPCMARAAYSLLRYEWIDPYMFTVAAPSIVELSELKAHSEHSMVDDSESAAVRGQRMKELEQRIAEALRRRSRFNIKRRAVIRAGLCYRIFRPRWFAQATPRYRDVAALLNLGKSVNPQFEPGVLGVPDFAEIRTHFTPEMLEHRASVGNLLGALFVFLFAIPLAAFAALPDYLGPLLPFRHVFRRHDAKRKRN